MCLAVPGRIIDLEGIDPAFRSATVDFCGIRKQVNLAFTPEVTTGDFVLVHVGFAIARIDEEEAKRTFRYLREIGALAEEGIDAERHDAEKTKADAVETVHVDAVAPAGGQRARAIEEQPA